MAVDPQKQAGGSIADEKDHLHDKQDTAAALVEVCHSIMDRYIAFGRHIRGDRSNDTELIRVKIAIEVSNLIIIAAPFGSVKFLQWNRIIDVDIFSRADNNLAIAVNDPQHSILKICDCR